MKLLLISLAQFVNELDVPDERMLRQKFSLLTRLRAVLEMKFPNTMRFRVGKLNGGGGREGKDNRPQGWFVSLIKTRSVNFLVRNICLPRFLLCNMFEHCRITIGIKRKSIGEKQ